MHIDLCRPTSKTPISLDGNFCTICSSLSLFNGCMAVAAIMKILTVVPSMRRRRVTGTCLSLSRMSSFVDFKLFVRFVLCPALGGYRSILLSGG